jgi:protein involved in polysaccharide export with SLBB domain
MNLKNIIRFHLLILILMSPLSISAEVSKEQQALVESLPPDQRASILNKMSKAKDLENEIGESFKDKPILIERTKIRELTEEEICEDCIYGYDFFQFAPSTFAPLNNVPISSNYILGPGDKLLINFYGNYQENTESFISRDGELFLPRLGPVNLTGMNFQQAQDFLKSKVESELIGTKISISLKEVRSINVYLLGESFKPGQYTISGLSGVTNALFVSGGVNEEGSLRNIQVKRDKKVIANYDFYNFLINGSTESDINLQDGDVIFVPFIENRVKLGGAFKRPHIYEFLPGETSIDAIKLAGGYASGATSNPKVELSSVNKEDSKRVISYLSGSDKSKYQLKDGDILTTPLISGLEQKTITIKGEVNNPGEYSIVRGDTVLDLMIRAGGYTEEGFVEGAVFLRESVAESQKSAFMRTATQLENLIVDIITKDTIQNISGFTFSPFSRLISRLRNEEPAGRMVVNLDLLTLKTDPLNNIILHDGDTIFIPKRPSSVSVVGEVLNSSTLGYNPELSSFDYINQAGGLNDAADPKKIFIVYPNGQSEIIKKTLFSSRYNILPGSTIVVSRDSRPFDALSLTKIITPVLADLATSAAAIAALSD